ncbi:hypothetical protein ACW2Q0_02515 [Nocardia sp. R16R-3T]
MLGTRSAAVGSAGSAADASSAAVGSAAVGFAAVALAATVAVPETALALDNLLPRGLHPGTLSDGVVVSAWIPFATATATSVVAAAAWSVVSRRDLHQIAFVSYGLACARSGGESVLVH